MNWSPVFAGRVTPSFCYSKWLLHFGQYLCTPYTPMGRQTLLPPSFFPPIYSRIERFFFFRFFWHSWKINTMFCSLLCEGCGFLEPTHFLAEEKRFLLCVCVCVRGWLRGGIMNGVCCVVLPYPVCCCCYHRRPLWMSALLLERGGGNQRR